MNKNQKANKHASYWIVQGEKLKKRNHFRDIKVPLLDPEDYFAVRYHYPHAVTIGHAEQIEYLLFKQYTLMKKTYIFKWIN